MKKFCFIILLVPSILWGQSLKESADDHFNNNRLKEAAADYGKYLAKNPSDSSAWFRLARTQVSLEEYDPALKSLKKARETNFNPSFVSFQEVKVYAVTNQEVKLIATLREAAENGLAAYAQLSNDTVFDPFRAHSGFKEALTLIEKNAYPCLSDANARHFDFWLGDWDVFARGQKAGENSITRAKGGCAIHENYKTAGNYVGQSINFYDPVDKKWHQHWVGSGGDVYNFLETAKSDGMLQLESKYMNPQGQINWMRMTFTQNEDGSVRQLMENSADERATWTTAFDGLYKKKMTESN